MGYLTDKNTIVSEIQNLYLIDRLLQQDEIDLMDIVDEVLGIFNTNYRENIAIDNMKSGGEEHFQLTRENDYEMGLEFFLTYADKFTREVIGTRFQMFYDRADDEKEKADFQSIVNAEAQKVESILTGFKSFKQKNCLLPVQIQLKIRVL